MKTWLLMNRNPFSDAVLWSLLTLVPNVMRADQVFMTITGKVKSGIDGLNGQARVFGGGDKLDGQPFTLTLNFDPSQGTPYFSPPFRGSILDSSNTGRAVASGSGPSAVLQIGGGSFTYGVLPGSLNWSIYRYSGVPIGGNSSFSSFWTEDYTGDHSGGSFLDRLWLVPTTAFPDGDWRSVVPTVAVTGSWISFNIRVSESITPTTNPALLKYATGQLIPETFTVSGPLAPCDICSRIARQSTSAEGKAESMRLCNMLLGALQELGGYRADFLAHFEFMNLFPAVYYNVTQLEMQRLADGGTFAHPIEHMQEMLDFFDAYKVNRDVWNAGGIAEPHWQDAFNKALIADLNPAFVTGLSVRDVLLSAITAHVQYDLSRALRYSFENIFDPNLAPIDLLPDFGASNQTLRDSGPRSQADIQIAAAGASSLAPWFQEFTDSVLGITDDVIKKREQAWVDAAADKPLIDLDGQPMGPQPITNHGILESKGAIGCTAAP